MTIGIIKPIDIDHEMQKAYLDYAMSVIVARALPDVRDGLKPVHRRILYAMHDMGITHDRPYKKSARIVGEVLGKYHPHGDAAVYESMVRMAQDFSLRYMLVDGQGNFGSIDGDNAAAMRYTEARLSRIAATMLDDIEKDTVPFGPNFDETLREPLLMPALLPNLLVNGANGIAVGMSTNVPPHNLSEVCDAINYLIDNYQRVDDVTIEDLMRFIQGPDFPTGGLVFRYGRGPTGEQEDLIAQSYAVGKGRFVIQAKAHLEEMSRNRSRIVVTELPYMTNKTRLIERIADLVREGRLDGISDLRDESDRTGMRIVIELTRTVEPQRTLDDLFKLTPMQQTFAVSLLALVDGEPRMLSLKKILVHYVEHRRVIIRRRAEFDLAKAKARAHIVEGLLIALNNLDEVIEIIRRSRTTETARENLMKRFKLSEIQAQAILDMPLKRLAQLERQKLEQEHKELLKLIKDLEALLSSDAKMLALIQEETRQLKDTFGDPRRTLIVDRAKGSLTAQDLLPDQDVWLTIDHDGSVARRPVGELSRDGARTLASRADVALLRANTRHYLAFFTRDGRAVRLGLHQTVEQGNHYADITGLTRRDRVVAAVALPREAGGNFITLVTRAGKIKRVTLEDFLDGVNNEPVSVFNVDDRDEVGWAALTSGGGELLVLTQQGQAIRFKEDDVRSTGLPAGGVAAIKLAKKDVVIFAAPVQPNAELLTATTTGFLKRSALSDFPTQGRAGGGVVAHSLNARTGNLAGAAIVSSSDLFAVGTTQEKWHSLAATDAPLAGRSTLGKQLVAVGSDEHVSSVVPLARVENASSPDEPPSKPPAKPSKTTRVAAPAPAVQKTAKPEKLVKPAEAQLTLKFAAETKAAPKTAARPAPAKSAAPPQKTLINPAPAVKKAAAKPAASKPVAAKPAPKSTKPAAPAEKKAKPSAAKAAPKERTFEKSAPRVAPAAKPGVKITPGKAIASRAAATSTPAKPSSGERTLQTTKPISRRPANS